MFVNRVAFSTTQSVEQKYVVHVHPAETVVSRVFSVASRAAANSIYVCQRADLADPFGPYWDDRRRLDNAKFRQRGANRVRNVVGRQMRIMLFGHARIGVA